MWNWNNGTEKFEWEDSKNNNPKRKISLLREEIKNVLDRQGELGVIQKVMPKVFCERCGAEMCTDFVYRVLGDTLDTQYDEVCYDCVIEVGCEYYNKQK